MKYEDRELFESCLNHLGLYEKKGLDNQSMLYPIKKKDRKLDKNEFNDMISRYNQSRFILRLYKVRDIN